jgi:pimeloyl-ACP methyl ester carboxylesterase
MTDATATFVLVPGAGGEAWYWHLVVSELLRRGQETLAVDLPAADPACGLQEYSDAILNTLVDRNHLILVAQSMGAFSAPLVCQRAPISLLVLVNPMVPRSGETAGEWWTNTGQPAAQREMAEREDRRASGEFDISAMFFHDVPQTIIDEALARGEPRQADTPFSQPWPLDRWPDVPTRVLIGRDDRLFPVEFQRRVVFERLRITPDEMPGGHLMALSQPEILADRLETYRRELR